MSDVVFIPIAHSGDAIELSLSELPSSGKWSSGGSRNDGFALSEMLGNELAHPDIWLRIAMSYFESDNLFAFENLLRDFTAEEAQHAYSDDRYKNGRIRIFNILAAYETRKASLAAKGNEQESAYNDATDLLNRSADLDPQATSTWIGKGVLMLLQGKIEDAQTAFNSALLSDVNKDNVLVRLGLGCIAVQKRSYAEALKHYKIALQSNPSLPGFVRLGFGLCYYFIGDMAQARASFQRVLDLSEGENVHALLGLATVELNSWRSRSNEIEISTRKLIPTSASTQAKQLQEQLKQLENDPSILAASEYLQKAYTLDPTNPYGLLLLSTHAFHTGDLTKSRDFALRAESMCQSTPSLSTNEMKGQCAYHVARAAHAAGAHLDAMKKYEEAKGYLPHHPPTCLGYAQMLLACRSETEHAIEVLEGVIAGANSRASSSGSASQDAKAMAAAASNNFEVLRLLGSLYAMPPSASALMTRAAALTTSKSSKSSNPPSSLESIVLPNYDKSFAYLKKSIDLHPNSLELLIEFADVSARLHEFNHAYLSYKRLLKLWLDIYQQPSEKVSSEMLNNLGVVCMELGKLNESKEYYEWSLKNKSSAEAISSNEDTNMSSNTIKADKLTTQFNIGLLYEREGRSEEAMKQMEIILDAYPSYTDAALFSSRVLIKGGSWSSAKAMLDRAATAASTAAASTSGSSVDVTSTSSVPAIQCAIANWHLAHGRSEDAKSTFESILAKSKDPSSLPTIQTRRDEYAKLALGNIAYTKTLRKIRSIQLSNHSLPLDHPTIQTKLRESKLDWKEVWSFYENVLSSSQHNKYAAHGLGCILATQGHVLEAKEVFVQIKDLANSGASGTSDKNGNEGEDLFIDVWVNLGHIYVLQGSFVSAIKMYQHVIDHFHSSNMTLFSSPPSMGLTLVQVLTFLARAYYLSDAFMDAKRTLLDAIHLHPTSTVLWYNLGLVEEAYAIDIFQKPPSFRTYREVESAILELNSAFSIFQRLQTTKISKEDFNLHGDVPEKAGRHAIFCRMSITNGQPHLIFARERETEQARLLEESRLAKTKLDEEEAEARARAEENAKLERERQEEEARAKKKYLEEISTTWETVRSEETVKKERAAAAAAQDDDDMPLPDLDADAELARRREKVKNRSGGGSKKRSKRENASGSDDDEDDHDRKKRRKEKKKGSGRSKYQTAEGSDAERSPSPAKESDNEAGGIDVDAELAARRNKAAHLTSITAGEPKEKKRLTKATADESDEDESRARMDVDDDGTGDASADVDADADAPIVDDVGAGGDDDEDLSQQARKKSNKKRRQIEDDEEEEENGTEQNNNEESTAQPAQDNTDMTDE